MVLTKRHSKKNICFVILSVIKYIHYEIPTVEKKNTKKEQKPKLFKNVLKKFFSGLCHGTTKKIALFLPFCHFCSKNCCPSPALLFVVCLAVVHPDWASCAASQRCTGCPVRDSQGCYGQRGRRWLYGRKGIVCHLVFVRLCSLLSSHSVHHGLVLSVLGGVEIGIAVVLFREYLVGGRCDVWQGNGVKTGVLDGLFDSGVSRFVLCVCVEQG